MTKTPPVVLTIAGFDPSGGAGVTADIKTIAAHGCYGVASVTALTVQSTMGVGRVVPLDEGLVRETLENLASDFELAAVHIGMLGNGEVAESVAGFLGGQNLRHIVLDPILRSSSGAELLDQAGAKVLKEKLIPLATVVTPNVEEAAALSGLEVGNPEQMRAAAARLHALGARAVVVTGGHLDPAVDVLSSQHRGGGEGVGVHGRKSCQSKSTHGTGCAFSTALACNLALQLEMPEAVRLAKEYVSEAIANAYPLGHGVRACEPYV